MRTQANYWTSYVLPALFVAGLYFTGLHVPVISLVQRGVLATGLLRPDLPPAGGQARPVNPSTAVSESLHFLMQRPNGEPVDARELAGKVVFINLWASWCPPCRAELPDIAALYADFRRDDRFAFVLLNVEADFGPGRQLITDAGYDFPVYHLQGGLPPALAATALPSTFVLDRSGRVVVAHAGMASYDTEEFRDFLRQLAASPSLR